MKNWLKSFADIKQVFIVPCIVIILCGSMVVVAKVIAPEPPKPMPTPIATTHVAPNTPVLGESTSQPSDPSILPPTPPNRRPVNPKSPNVPLLANPAVAATPAPQSKVVDPNTACNPNYVPCITDEGVLTCVDIGIPVIVKGNDQYGLDSDGNGTACEEYARPAEEDVINEDPTPLPLPDIKPIPVLNGGYPLIWSLPEPGSVIDS